MPQCLEFGGENCNRIETFRTPKKIQLEISFKLGERFHVSGTCKAIDGKLSKTLQKFFMDCTTNFVQEFPNFVCDGEAYVLADPLFTDGAAVQHNILQ